MTDETTQPDPEAPETEAPEATEETEETPETAPAETAHLETDDQVMHYNTAGTHILVFHPDLEQRWESPPEYLQTALQRGWVLAEPEPEDDVEVDVVADLFDPTAHNKAAVEAHLAAHAETDPAEVIRVIELERAGKARKTIAVPDGFDPIVTG